MLDDIPYIDGVYAKYRRMWKEDRWKFSGELVNLTIKKNKEGMLSAEEQHIFDTMHRVVNENRGNWLEGFDKS
ncbi:hypothetical protein ACFO3D_12410 [Virgibacillus kekensis]|uniref:Uncharacterized protein n=1 Tax=Virgibacillus kekensis TaxID=202261 RepID=A0ABV9DLH2_9BACI